MTELRLPEGALASASESLATASDAWNAGGSSRPTGDFASLTGIVDDVERFLRGVSVASAALSDAARTAGQAARALLEDASRIDAAAAAALDAGFALKR